MMAKTSSWQLSAQRTGEWATEATRGAGNAVKSWLPDPSREWTKSDAQDAFQFECVDDSAEEGARDEEAAIWANFGRRALAKRMAEDLE